ncbi:MAG: hypothetical protein Q4F84_09355 [Fibrobacter sp.]|nr:hypothetical protein [Fibrobacter sp.]
MRESDFRTYLENAEQINSKNKAVNSRISRANTAEEILNGESLDYIVADDERMYAALVRINDNPKERGGNIQNAVRWYYKFANGKSFPTLVSYRRLYNK